MADLIHCIYASTARDSFSDQQLTELLRRARLRNTVLGVTGMLLYDRGSFFQALEGNARLVEALFERIAADPRHHRVVEIINEPIPRRAFADWSMGFSMVDPARLRRIDGLNDFFGAGRSLADLDEGRARKLFQAFAAGRWRRRIEAAEALETQD